MKKTNVIWLVFLCALVSIAATAYGCCIGFLQWNVAWYALCLVAFFVEGTAVGATLLFAERLPHRLAIPFSLLIGAVAVGVVVGLSFLINNVILKEHGESMTAEIIWSIIIFLSTACALFHTTTAPATAPFIQILGSSTVWKERT